ncbi:MULTISPECIES: hypothetical protein [Fusobacterium]|jgi:hypothetical protein|uniref:hypothetical protein n=1 Tax=Fusobacterium TaxID=848 RepID=UPI0022E7E65F|nr:MULTISPECIES: hypothetical protein [Fusobacterium]
MRVRIKNGKYICNFTDMNGTLRVIITDSTSSLYSEVGKILGFTPTAARKTGLI